MKEKREDTKVKDKKEENEAEKVKLKHSDDI